MWYNYLVPSFVKDIKEKEVKNKFSVTTGE